MIYQTNKYCEKCINCCRSICENTKYVWNRIINSIQICY